MEARRKPRKYTDELNHPKVAGWYESIRVQNPETAINYLQRLVRGVREALDISPADLVAMKQEDLGRAAEACVEHLLKHGTASTSATWRTVLSSFLKWNGRALQDPAHILHGQRHFSAEDEEIPSQEDLARVLAACVLRDAAALALQAQGGLRPKVQRKSHTGKGLRLRHLADLEYGPDGPCFRRIPARINVPRGLDKNSRRHFTFIGPEGCHYVIAYLRWRVDRGEELGPDSPLFAPLAGEPRFCSSETIPRGIRRAMRRAGLSQRVYVWRAYFASRCMMAEPSGLPGAWRRFFMGHAGDVQTTYALRKRLSEDLIELMRQAYAEALPYLESKDTLDGS